MKILSTGNENEKQAPGPFKGMEPKYGKRAFDRGLLPSCRPNQVPYIGSRPSHLQIPALQPMDYEETEGFPAPAYIM